MGTRGPSLGLIVALALFAGHSLAAEMTIEQARKFVRNCKVETLEGTLKEVERNKDALRKLPSRRMALPNRVAEGKRLSRVIEAGKKRAKELEEGKAKPWREPPQLSLPPSAGDIGQLGLWWKSYVVQVLGATEMIVKLGPAGSDHPPVLIRGKPSAGIADGTNANLYGTYEVLGTEMYPTASGATNTIMVLEPFSVEEAFALVEREGLGEK